MTTSMNTDTEIQATVTPGTRMNLNKLGKYKADITKKVVSLKEDSKGKTEMVMAYIKEDSPLKNGVTVLQKKVKEEILKQEGSENEEENSESKLRKLTQGLGKKIKDIRSDIVEIKDEGLQSLSDLKEVYQEKAEQKKAIINSFTEEEVKIMRKGAQLPAQFSKQINTLYLAKRLGVVRCSIIACGNLERDLIRGFDGLFIKAAIGLEKFKSRIVIISSSDNFQWNETFTLPRQTAEEKYFEIEMLARNPRDTMTVGRGQVDLNSLNSDSMNHFHLDIRDSSSALICSLEIVLWVTGINDQEVERSSPTAPTKPEFCLDPLSTKSESVGELTVTVMEATGLGSSKLQGVKSVGLKCVFQSPFSGSLNPYCQLEMENYFFRTNAQMKTKSPIWNKTFSFDIRDPFSVLHISVLRFVFLTCALSVLLVFFYDLLTLFQ